MSLSADEFMDESARAGWRKRCGIERVLCDLSDADRDVVQRILAKDPLDVTAGAIARVLNRHGYRVTHQWVTAHRQHRCSCFKDDELYS